MQMVELDSENRAILIQFVQKHLIQLINTAFAAIDDPKEAMNFIYERLYFAYATDKRVVIDNIQKLEALYHDIPTNNFKERMILKVTRPIVKINFLLNGDKALLELVKFPAGIDLTNEHNIKSIRLYTDYILSKFIKALFDYKKSFTTSSRDEIAEFISSAIDNLGIVVVPA